jgi:hypothetical protein
MKAAHSISTFISLQLDVIKSLPSFKDMPEMHWGLTLMILNKSHQTAKRTF